MPHRSSDSARIARPRWFTSAALSFALGSVVVPAARADDLSALPETSARAAADLEEARRLTRDGLKLFQSGRYGEAIALFRGAYVLLPAPGLLYNLAQAQRLNGDCRAAIESYQEFLLRDPNGPLSELSRGHLASCQDRAEPSSAPQKTVPTEGSPSSAAAPSAPALPIRKASTPSLAVSPDARLSAASESHPARAAAIVSFASAGAWLALGGYFGWRAQAASNEVSGVFEDENRWTGEAANVEDGGRRDENLAIAATVTGLVAAGFGVWLWTW